MSTSPQVQSTPVDERSWRPVAGRSGLTIRRKRLLLLGSAIVGFLLLFIWLLRRPILEPQVHLIGFQSSSEQLDSHWSVRSTRETLYSTNVWSGLEELCDQLSAGKWSEGKRNTNLFFSSPPETHRFLEQLRTVSDSSSDVLILFINTQAVNRDGKAMFSWEGRSGEENRWWDAQQLIDALRAHPASLKFVVLDAGQTQWAPQQGILIADYLNVLKSQLQETHDPSLWVLCSHSSGEISYLDYKHGNSLFGIAVQKGMRGEADFDGNGVITIREMTQYTVWKVEAWSQRYAGYDCRQTPQILWGNGDLDIDSTWPDLIPVVEEMAETQDEPPEEVAEEDLQNETAGFFPSSNHHFDYLAGVVQQTFRTIPRSVKGRLIPASGMGLPGMMFLWQVAPETQATGADGAESKSPLTAVEAESESVAPQPQIELAGTATPAGIVPPSEKQAQDAEVDDSGEEINEFDQSLLEAWKIRDRLISSEGKTWVVSTRFPLEFRRLEQELIRLEFLAQDSNGVNRAGWKRQLARIVGRFQTMEEELRRKIPLPTDSDPVEGIVKQQPFHSLALSRMRRSDTDPELLRIEQTLRMLMTAFELNDRVAAQKLAEALKEDRRFIEVELACLLADLPTAVPGVLKKNTLQNRFRMEQLVPRAFGYHEWIRDRFRLTELRQARSEVVLLNHISGHYVAEARQLIERIAFELDGIESDLTTVIETDRLTSELCSRLNEYIKLSRLSGDVEAGLSPTSGELAEMIALLSDVAQQFSHPDPKKIPQLARISHRLSARDRLIRNRISESIQRLTQTSGPNTSELGWQREVLLRVPLVSGPERRSLWNALAATSVTEIDTSSTELPSLAGLTAPALSPRTVEEMKSQLRLQARLAELALSPGSPSNSHMQSLSELALIDPSWIDAILLTRCSKFGLQLEALYLSVMERMTVELPLGLTALNAEQSSSRLRGWSTFTKIVSPAVTGRHYELEPAALLFSADLRGLLAWQLERLEQQRSASNSVYTAESLPAEHRYRRALRLLWPGIPAAEVSSPLLELRAPQTLTLSQSELPVIELVCQNHFDQKLRGVLVLEYDRRSIGASFSSPANGLAVSADDDGILQEVLFPKDSEFLNLELEPHSSQTIVIQLSWRNLRSRLSPVALTFLGRSQDQQNKTRTTVYSQQTIRLERPFSDSWSLSLREGVASDRDQSFETGLVLYPFPNRETNYSLQLDYLGENRVRVDVELFEQLPKAIANEHQNFVLKAQNMAFSAESRSAPLKWSSTWVKDVSMAESEREEAPASPAARSIRPNLVLKISDPESGHVASIPVRIQTQRPRRYLKTSVSYDRERELVRVHLESRPGIPLPSAEIPIVCRLDAEPGSAKPSAEVAAIMSSENPKLELKLPLPSQIDRTRRLSISVDGVEREFLYAIPTDQTVSNLPEQLDRSRLEIVSPSEGEAFALQGESLTLNLEIDLPVADLWQQQFSVADVWLDSVPNRQIDPSESVEGIHSDRMVEIMLQEPDANGRFKIITHISDWEILLPRSGLPEGELEILGTLRTSRGLESSTAVAIVMDGEAPKVKSRAPEYVVEKASFPITLVPTRADSSGISRVDAQIDLSGTGRIAPELTVYKGVRIEQDGQWRCLIPTTDLPPGRYTVLLQAHDAVGNSSEIVSQMMNIVSTEQLKLLEPGESVPLTGVVVYGKDPVPEATVTLTRGTPGTPQSAVTEPASAEDSETMTVQADEAGRFRFESVPSGEWTLKASMLLLNRLRTYEQSVQIAPPPTSAGIMRIRLR